MSEEIDHWHTDEIVCPYCGHKHEDSWEISGKEEDSEADCHACGKTFDYSTSVKIYYTTSKKEPDHAC